MIIFVFYSFHQTSWNFVGISTGVCGSCWEVEQIQNGGRCHGNQGAKNVRFTSNFTKFCSNVSFFHLLCNKWQEKTSDNYFAHCLVHQAIYSSAITMYVYGVFLSNFRLQCMYMGCFYLILDYNVCIWGVSI
jgi:hypothetical protein